MKDIRFVTVKKVTYLCKEDVVDYIRDLAGSEETDVRNRLIIAAQNLSEVSCQPQKKLLETAEHRVSRDDDDFDIDKWWDSLSTTAELPDSTNQDWTKR